MDEPTFFYSTAVAVIGDAKAIKRKTRRCPPNVFHRLEEIAALTVKANYATTAPDDDGSVRDLEESELEGRGAEDVAES